MSDEPQSVTAEVFYFTPPEDGSKPYTDLNADPRNNWNPEPHSVEVENLRSKEGSVTLDTAGFQCGRGAAAHKTFTSDAEIKAEYYPESIELMKKITGASRAVVFDHRIRRRRPGETGPTTPEALACPAGARRPDEGLRHGARAPTPPAGGGPRVPPAPVTDHQPLAAHLHPAYDWLLALCDYQSVDRKTDLVPTDLITVDRKGETDSVRFNPSHQWKYLRGLTPEEFILIKCFDSKTEDNTATMTPHTAFHDPSTPKDALPRKSIELRMLVFYD
ncbi:uncharacterized protein C8Q71DRAFT_288021 [Rhodofomes roseus]|uniref:Methyltransferase n=1 Tax=Rhodofomes roseus TaxID=34475 RepID=A0ABQ8K4Q0_9APHY|nr:uncharacterized protein C8Q71DRAFT_288021 [Rhodofomes roseus]KAH9831862.1 hypothetical protein C8Q71DRAFT_288021 [Rhodofomes roseus]